MKAITICQPYADLIVRGEKQVENRSWPTRYRGKLAIHAGKSREWLRSEDEHRSDLIFGAVVAYATLVDCVPLDKIPRRLVGHAHALGPWCWILGDVKALERPVYIRGAQGLWEWHVVAAIGAKR